MQATHELSHTLFFYNKPKTKQSLYNYIITP